VVFRYGKAVQILEIGVALRYMFLINIHKKQVRVTASALLNPL